MHNPGTRLAQYIKTKPISSIAVALAAQPITHSCASSSNFRMILLMRLRAAAS